MARHLKYDTIKARGPHESYPVGTILLRWWEHCEVIHDASPDDFGMNVKKWHDENYPDCKLPSAEHAKQVEWRDTDVIATRIMKDPKSTVADRQIARMFLGLPDQNDNQI